MQSGGKSKKGFLKIFVLSIIALFVASSFSAIGGSVQSNNIDEIKTNPIDRICTYDKEEAIRIHNTEYPKKTINLDDSDIMALNPLKYKIGPETNEMFGSKTMPFCLVANSNKLWVGGRAYIDGTWDTYVCMFSLSGSEPELIWHRTLDYEGYDDTIRGIVYNSGYIYVVGHSTMGNNRLLLLKYDSDTGEYITGIASGSNSNPTVGTAIKYYNGYLYASGSKKHDDGIYRVTIRKYSTNFDYKWGYYLNPFEGGPEYGYDMDLYDGHAYITGVCNYVGHEFQLYPFMVKFNVNSEKSSWQKSYGMAWWSQVAQSCVRSGSKIYYTGIDMGMQDSMDIMHAYIRDSDGWQDGTVDRYWGDYYDDDLGYDLIEHDGYLYTAGSTESYSAKAFDAVLLKTDKSFKQKWYELWGGSNDEEAYAVYEYNGNIYTTGYTKSYGSASISAFLLKYSTSGSKSWDVVWCYENHPPNKPGTPSGTSSGSAGSTYSYSTSTTDMEGDDIYYWFDWGDNTNSGWVGPYSSGETAKKSHSWSYGSYTIKVKAKDSNGEQSEWSGYKSISMPKIKVSVLLKNLQIYKFLSILIR
jgi:hypothetical protein